MARATGTRRPRRHPRVENVEPIGAPERGLATWGEWSALGGERAYRGRLGKDRSAYQSRRSIAKREVGFTAGNGSPFLLSFVRIATGGINVGHTRFRYPRAIRGRFLHHAVMIRKSATLTATYCLLTTVVSNTATSPTTLTRMVAPALTVQ